MLDGEGRTIPRLTPGGMRAMIERGEANAGMVAKLTACGEALAGGVGEIRIFDGRSAANFENGAGTAIVPE